MTLEEHAVIAIVGPTGTGKTALALDLAARIGAEIVNLDSRQVYRGLDIGSAKPSAAEQASVPHHLFDVVAPDEPFDCVRYRALARLAIAQIQQRGRRVLLVGGTGLYLKVLRYGIFPGPERDPALRARLAAIENAEPGWLHARLSSVDPDAAHKLHPHDRARLIRALEVYERSGKPISAWQQEHGFRRTELEVRVIGLETNRGTLYAGLNARCGEMVQTGLIEEVRDLWKRGYGPELPSMRAIGYREIGRYLTGQYDLDRAVEEMARATRHLAKRQLTWFRAVEDITWLDAQQTSGAELARLVQEKPQA